MSSPALIASEIETVIQDLVGEAQQRVFVGRREDIENIERELTPIGGSPEPQLFCLYGLSGLGRRTILRKARKDLLQDAGAVEVAVEVADNVSDIALKVSAIASPPASPEQMVSVARRYSEIGEADVIPDLMENVASINKSEHLPYLLDAGGLIDNDGFFSPLAEALFATLSEQRVRLAVVSRRSPARDPSSLTAMPTVRIDGLSKADTRVLVSRLARNSGTTLSGSEIEQIADYVRGYPPAAYYAIRLLRQYGTEYVLNDISKLVNYRVGLFLQFLEQDQMLDDDRRACLAALSIYSPLPLAVVGRYLGVSAEELDRIMSYLLEAALVVPRGRFYGIADPIADVVFRAFRGLSVEHVKIKRAVADYLHSSEDAEGDLELARILYQARRFSGEQVANPLEVRLASDVAHLAEQFYHSRDYDACVEMAEEALVLRPDNVEILSYLVRALVQLERYEHAESRIARIERLGFLRDSSFLRGFLARHRHHYPEAIKQYEASLGHGRRGVAVHRELAQCYLEVDNLIKADEHIARAQKEDRDNRYVVDLRILIAMKTKKWDLAQELLDILKVVDKPMFYWHRRSTVEYAKGFMEEAVASAVRSLEGEGRPSFAIRSNYVKCLIDSGRLEEAENEMNALDRDYRSSRHDIRLGLRIKLAERRGKYLDALALWERLRDKTQPVHMALKLRALEQKIASGNGNSSEQSEADEISAFLTRIGKTGEHVNAVLGVIQSERLSQNAGHGPG